MVTTPAASTLLSALPAFASPNPEIEALKQQLAATQATLNDTRERERETQRQSEIRDLRESMGKMVEATNIRLETLMEKLSSRPAENSELTELKRRFESQDQLNAIRAETKATTDAILAMVRENSQNRGIDPMINVLTSILTQQQAAANTNVQLMRDMSSQERQTIMSMMEKQHETLKDSGSLDIVQKVMGGMDMIFDRLRQVTQLEREIAGNSGGGIDWMALIKEIGGRAGSAVQAYQQAKAHEADAVTAQARAQVATAQARTIQARTDAAVKIAEQRTIAAVAQVKLPQ
jgi:hypothetical protein